MALRDVIGHASTVAALRTAVARDALPHALLFLGRRGVGKRRTAAALAAAKYCEARSDGDGCGACPACVAAESGSHADIEILERAAGKRDIGIASIRGLQEALHRTSRSGRGRFAIVDGAERLTEDAQNAFLKTLEEPPLGSTIVMIATSGERLLPTIRSRCAVHRFGALARADLERFAHRIGGGIAVPLELARGSPGAWLELATKPNPEARDVALDLLVDRGASPFAFASRWLELSEHEDDPELPDVREPANAPKNLRVEEEEEVASDAAEIGRRRLLDWLLLVEWGLRDLAVARECESADELATRAIHADRARDLWTLASTLPSAAPLVALEAVERARGDLYRSVDRGLALEAMGVAVLRALRAR
jgi:DNA polymerase III delta' subunit